MKHSVRDDIIRYEAMARLCDYVNPNQPDEADKDRVAYGEKYVPEWTAEGRGALSATYVIRFLVEVCGHSYESALAGLVEDMRAWPDGEWPEITPDQHAQNLIEEGGDIIETLFNLKVCRMAARTHQQAAFYSAVTQALIRQRRKPPRVNSYVKSSATSAHPARVEPEAHMGVDSPQTCHKLWRAGAEK